MNLEGKIFLEKIGIRSFRKYVVGKISEALREYIGAVNLLIFSNLVNLIYFSRRKYKYMYYAYQDFNKKDKRLIQSLLEVSAKNEIKNFMIKMLPDHQGMVEKEHEDIRKTYWEFFDSFKDFSKHLNRRYDSNSHRDLPRILTCSRVEGNLTDVHFADFSEDGNAKFEELLFIEKKRRE